MVTLTQIAASTAPCQFSVNVIDAEGNPYDPTGDAVTVAAWAVTSPQVAFNPGTATGTRPHGRQAPGPCTG